LIELQRTAAFNANFGFSNPHSNSIPSLNSITKLNLNYVKA